MAEQEIDTLLAEVSQMLKDKQEPAAQAAQQEATEKNEGPAQGDTAQAATLAEAQTSPRSTKIKVKQAARWLFSLIFYLLMAAMLLVALIARGNQETPQMIGDYSFLVVLSDSMQEKIPVGSLVVIKQVDAAEIQVGDAITFMSNEKRSTTHEVVQVLPNYKSDGSYGFRTWGVSNDSWDRDLVDASNVVGKVVFHNFFLGIFFSYVRENVWQSVLICALIYLLFFAVRRFIVLNRKEKALREAENNIQ